RPLGRFQFLSRVYALAGFEQQRLHARRGQHVSGHAARRARSDYDRVVDFFEIDSTVIRNIRSRRLHRIHLLLKNKETAIANPVRITTRRTTSGPTRRAMPAAP